MNANWIILATANLFANTYQFHYGTGCNRITKCKENTRILKENNNNVMCSSLQSVYRLHKINMQVSKTSALSKMTVTTWSQGIYTFTYHYIIFPLPFEYCTVLLKHQESKKNKAHRKHLEPWSTCIYTSCPT